MSVKKFFDLPNKLIPSSYILDCEFLHRGLELNKNLVTRSQLSATVGGSEGSWLGQARVLLLAAAIIAG